MPSGTLVNSVLLKVPVSIYPSSHNPSILSAILASKIYKELCILSVLLFRIISHNGTPKIPQQ